MRSILLFVPRCAHPIHHFDRAFHPSIVGTAWTKPPKR
jgi:hypothetical protein